jgi:hypothetical protein
VRCSGRQLPDQLSEEAPNPELLARRVDSRSMDLSGQLEAF